MFIRERHSWTVARRHKHPLSWFHSFVFYFYFFLSSVSFSILSWPPAALRIELLPRLDQPDRDRVFICRVNFIQKILSFSAKTFAPIFRFVKINHILQSVMNLIIKLLMMVVQLQQREKHIHVTSRGPILLAPKYLCIPWRGQPSCCGFNRPTCGSHTLWPQAHSSVSQLSYTYIHFVPTL